jgi:DNA-binding CsgD family transcriptional regulator
MSSIKENNELRNRNQQRSNSGSTPATATSATQAFKRKQGNNNNNSNNTREEEVAKRTKRRPTKVGLNDTLRRIRHLIVEGRSNSEIQDILQLEERTFYRYMAKIYEIDRALFAEQEKKILITEAGIFKDRLLRSYRWFIAIADNENMKAEIRMEAQNAALQVALAVLKSELEGPKFIRKQGPVDNIFDHIC